MDQRLSHFAFMSEWLKLIFPGIMIVKATPANAGKETILGRSELPLVVIGGAAGPAPLSMIT
jgi:hypothetical protein